MTHTLSYLAIDGLFPAATCACGWGTTFSRTDADTRQTVKARLDKMHEEHVTQTENTNEN